MKSNKILYHSLLLILSGYFFISCENRNTQEEYAERDAQNERIDGESSDDALNPGSYIDVDPTDPELEETLKQNRFIPLTIYNVIKNDSILRNQELIDSRPLKKDNKIYYEVHFQRDDKITTVIFDLEGNHSDDYI